MASRRAVLVVARPSPLRDSLTTLLMTIPRISAVRHADGAAAGYHLVEVTRPSIVVLDASLPGGEAWALLRSIKARWPHIVCVMLTDTTRSRDRAEAAGATQAFLKGYPAAKLSKMLEQLLGRT
ncbi:MAG: response regulator [Anaerolineae bacterium]